MSDAGENAALRRTLDMLEKILLREIELHEAMLSAAEEKRRAIIDGDVEGLEKGVALEKRLVEDIEAEEEKRKAVTALVKRGIDMPEKEEKLSELVERLPGPDKEKFSAIREKLRSVIDACRQKTRHNAELLKASLAHVDAFLKTVAEAAGGGEKTYGRDGKKSGSGPAILDRNA